MSYSILFLDADETLLDFKKAEEQALYQSLQMHGLLCNEEILHLYSRINKKCWEEFEQGRLTKPQLLVERFRRLFVEMDVKADPDCVRKTYQDELGKGAFLIDGAYETCEALSKSCQLYIVTNGVSATQYSRFRKSGLDQIVDGIFVSEDMGFQKPQKEYFDAVLKQLEYPDKKEILLVGDSLSADMQGGINAGIDTCWYNPEKKPLPATMTISFEIHSIQDLLRIVLQ